MYFVMINHPALQAVPFVDDNGDVIFFEKEIEAFIEAKENGLANHFGFEVFQLGTGSTLSSEN